MNEDKTYSEARSDEYSDKKVDVPSSSGNYRQKLNEFCSKIRGNNKAYKAIRITAVTLGSILVVSAVLFYLLFAVPAIREISSHGNKKVTSDKELRKDPNYKKLISGISKDIQRLSKKFSSYTSGQSYIVINTTDNRFSLYKNKKLIREGFCSSGSYIMLKTEGEKKWIFKTPKGKYWIQGKITSPVWKKPDWAFVEEGLPIPPKDDPSRWEYGVLGDYALSIGDGYLIHGTLYKRFLGMPVTHGCVRLNDEDLEAIYNNLNIGSKVYIF
jgi:hypothetical protein